MSSGERAVAVRAETDYSKRLTFIQERYRNLFLTLPEHITDICRNKVDFRYISEPQSSGTGFLRSSFLKKPKEHTSLRIYVDSDLFLTLGDTIADHLQILKKISAETVLALPKIIRLRDSRYLKLLEKSIRDNSRSC